MAKAKKAAKKPAAGAAKKASALLKKPKAGDKSYSKSQFIAHLAEAVTARNLGAVSKKQAAAFVEELVALLITYAPVKANLPGLGKLVLRKTKARMGRNPQTGEPVKIAASKAPKFSAGSAFKATVKSKGKAAPKKAAKAAKPAAKKTAKKK
jgi:DNA-binding protein HU-beta